MNRLLLSAVLTLLACASLHGERGYPTLTTPSGEVLRLELAVTEEARAYGLMFRASMPADMGMLFIFDHCAPHSFWMKNCFIPLDILWLDREGMILSVMENLPPCRSRDCPNYEPSVDACFVLEVNGGRARELGLTVGTTIDLTEVLPTRPPTLLRSHGNTGSTTPPPPASTAERKKP